MIAYEIHDGPVQYVTAALMHLETAHQRFPSFPPNWIRPSRPPRPVPRYDLRVAPHDQRLAADAARRVRPGACVECLINDHYQPGTIRFEHHLRTERLTPLLEGILFRIAQEALTNATKHSQSPQIQIRCTQEHAWVRLEVIDQGVGFDPNQPTVANSFGLRGIRERARLLGGHAMINSAARPGMRMAVELPVTDA